MQPIVPASTRVRASRVQFIDTDRLQRRQAFLAEHAPAMARGIDGPDNPGGRNFLWQLAREILAIDAELARRESA